MRTKASDVNAMFTHIASRYDFMNRLMSLGRDRFWRRELLKAASLPDHGRMLDVGSGTADLAIESTIKGVPVIALDFCPAMMSLGQAKAIRKGLDSKIDFILGDAEALPFADDSFDGIVTGFTLRNVTSIARCFTEMHRVLKPGSRAASLELVTPSARPVRALHHIYVGKVIPVLGRLMTRDGNAYSYLPRSIAEFPKAEEVKAVMEQVGFRSVRYKLLNWGTVAIHWGMK